MGHATSARSTDTTRGDVRTFLPASRSGVRSDAALPRRRTSASCVCEGAPAGGGRRDAARGGQRSGEAAGGQVDGGGGGARRRRRRGRRHAARGHARHLAHGANLRGARKSGARVSGKRRRADVNVRALKASRAAAKRCRTQAPPLRAKPHRRASRREGRHGGRRGCESWARGGRRRPRHRCHVTVCSIRKHVGSAPVPSSAVPAQRRSAACPRRVAQGERAGG
jgi:hypothetical protein